ncbi:helix-turn-helix domain-containing protein [Oceanobacillus damuensis]|uniref:helix-turn-helix domain-containing protein n=1 Tax=Oceanobacillus damuensis TaxID=937928 RepID=UPI000833562A|nr:helix-turn-helix transcriptional regulator [Oceanobacillus damuensis]
MGFNLRRLKYERMSRNISQEEMAKCLGMNHTSYWKRENGRVPISVNEFIKILKVLDIPEYEIQIFLHKELPNGNKTCVGKKLNGFKAGF